MTRRPILYYYAVLLMFVSCATVEAIPTPVVEQIEGFTAQSPADDSTQGLSEVDQARLIQTVPKKHNGAVTSLASVTENSFLSAGSDGFITLHKNDGTGESWQISDMPIRRIAVHPDGNTFAVYESDGFSIHRISVWEWNGKKRLYAKRFRDSVISLSWSARGRWLFVGNTSIEGLTVLEGRSGNSTDMFKSPVGLVSLSVTGNSEANVITFGPSGKIVYTDTANGTVRASYPGEADLSNPALLNNNRQITGEKNGLVYVLDATSGINVRTYAAPGAILATMSSDEEPFWFEHDKESGRLVLKNGEKTVANLTIPAQTAITVALGTPDRIIFGTENGFIYSIPRSVSVLDTSAGILAPFPFTATLPIEDIASDGERVFLLSGGSVFISSGPGRAPLYAFGGIQANRINLTDDRLIFWSTDNTYPVMSVSFDGDQRKVVFQPEEPLRSFSWGNGYLVFVSGSFGAVVFDEKTNEQIFSYSAAGLQEAVPAIPGQLIVSKSASARSDSPLLLIDIKTGETVPLPVSGELCYGLQSMAREMAALYGFAVRNDASVVTELFELTFPNSDSRSPRYRPIAAWGDEDLTASLSLSSQSIVTNLGKTALVEITASSGRQVRFDRAYALPIKNKILEQFVLSLNSDGSLSWFERRSGKLISTGALLANGNWSEQIE